MLCFCKTKSGTGLGHRCGMGRYPRQLVPKPEDRSTMLWILKARRSQLFKSSHITPPNISPIFFHLSNCQTSVALTGAGQRQQHLIPPNQCLTKMSFSSASTVFVFNVHSHDTSGKGRGGPPYSPCFRRCQ